MTKLVMNERMYAENIINGEGFDENGLYTATVLAKYYKFKGYENAEIRDALRKIMRKSIPVMFEKYGEKWIKKALVTANSHPLYVIDNITITRSEVDRINLIHSSKFKDYRLRRLAFTLLCLAKYYAEKGVKDGWVNMPQKYIFSIASLKGMAISRQNLMLHELYQDGYIDFSNKVEDDSIKIAGIMDGESEVVVDNINEAGLIFEEYNGKRFIRCQRCGCRVPVTNGRAKLCKPCGVVDNREKVRERTRRKRQKN